MEHILRIIGALIIVGGVYGGYLVYQSNSEMAAPAIVFITAMLVPVGVILMGVLFLAFGTAIDLLRKISRR